MRRKTTKEFIEEAKEIHGNKYEYSKIEYTGSNNKVCITCPIHGDFWQTPANHLFGQGCKFCNNTKRYNLRKKTTEEFIKEAKAVHGDKYDYSKVEYKNIDIKVCITCPMHGEFWQTPNSHLSGCGCQKCAGNVQKTTKEFIKEAKAVHGDKYDYSKVEYTGAHNKVCIICLEHGEFWQTPANHLFGSNCPKCCKSKKKTTEEFIEKAKEVHGDKYDYSKVVYTGSRNKVCIICHNHGEFWQRPHDHLRGCGCQRCYIEEISSKDIQKNKLSFIEKATLLHNNKYDYSKIEYTNSHNKVCIICPEHGEFWQTPNSHLSGCGCQKCVQSIFESDISNFLDKKGINYTKEQRFNWMKLYRLDFYLPEYNAAIECQGIQHFLKTSKQCKGFDFDNQLRRDEEKYKLCEENGVKIFYFTKKEHLHFKNTSLIYENNLYYDKDEMMENIINKAKIRRSN